MTKIVKVRTSGQKATYPIEIGYGVLEAAGDRAAGLISNPPGRAAIVSNPTVFKLYGNTILKAFKTAGFNPVVHLIGDGERFKNLKTLENALKFFSESKLARTDIVVALGGGVVGDLAGFAAAVYLRGVDFLQIPTTLLSMVDSSVGGKTGVNSSFGKNLIGAFYQPKVVFIDTETLNTLPARELTAGFCEAVKQGAIGGPKLFNRTANFLASFDRKHLKNKEKAADIASLLADQVSFKARIVAGDERESASKTDSRSRKILNFGHTFGHALEKVTKYRYFKHGEAVGHGIRFAAALSKNLGLLGPDELNLLNDVVRRAGELPPIHNIDPREIFATFRYDKKIINNSLHWILLRKIGEPVVFPHSDVSQSALTSAFKIAARG